MYRLSRIAVTSLDWLIVEGLFSRRYYDWCTMKTRILLCKKQREEMCKLVMHRIILIHGGFLKFTYLSFSILFI